MLWYSNSIMQAMKAFRISIEFSKVAPSYPSVSIVKYSMWFKRCSATNDVPAIFNEVCACSVE